MNSNEPNLRAVIYCRVSSKAQEADGSGLSSQQTRCAQYASAKGYEVVTTFPDTVSGGGDFLKRKGMVALLAFLDAHPTERFVVIFDDLKRYARDVEFHLKLKREMDARSAIRECLNFNFQDTPEGEFHEIMMAATGQLERKQNARQVSQKMKARMDSGYYVLRAPLGYEYRKVEGRGRMLFPVEPFASIIREGFEGYASGRFATLAEVARFFERFPDFPRNKDGRVLRQKAIDVLGHPIYSGHICSDHYDIHWLKGHHEPIISLDLFEKVQERRKGLAHAPKRANIGDDFALRGIAACASCGANLRSSWSRGCRQQYAYYLCQTKGCDSYGKSIPRDKLEDDVGEIIKSLEPGPNMIDLVTAMFRTAWDAKLTQAKTIITSSKQEVARLEKEIETILDRIMSASNEAIIRRYEDKVDELEKRKALMLENMSKQIEPKGSFDEKLELALGFLANPWKLWENGNINVRRLVLKLAFAGPVAYCRNGGARTPAISFPFKALHGSSNQYVCYGGVGET